MFSFTKEQKIFEVSGVKIGGQPGRLPTVCIGGLFFKGVPDFEKAEEYLSRMYAVSEKTNVSCIPDFFIKKEEYVEGIIGFILKNIPKNYPFSIDIIEPGLKVKTLELLNEKNLLNRVIYNSVHIGVTDEERDALKKFTPGGVIVVAFNPKDKSPDGKLEVLENGAHLIDMGLLDLVKNLGIKEVLVDTAAMAPGDISGAAVSAIPVIKEEYGLPTGCAIHNVVEKSNWLDGFGGVRKTVDFASNVNIPLFGGDFVIFGPVENAEMVFPLIAWEDILVSEYVESYFGIEPDDVHPRRKFY